MALEGGEASGAVDMGAKADRDSGDEVRLPDSRASRWPLMQMLAAVSRLRRFLQEGNPFARLGALLLLALGWLLSPFCWWNDLVFNLPLAWGLGKLLALANPLWFTPGLVLGYWGSNVAGILLMQSSAMEIFHDSDKPRRRARELLIGLASSTLYSLVIVFLVRLEILHFPQIG